MACGCSGGASPWPHVAQAGAEAIGPRQQAREVQNHGAMEDVSSDPAAGCLKSRSRDPTGLLQDQCSISEQTRWPSPGHNLVLCRRGEPQGMATPSLPFPMCRMEHRSHETNWLFFFGSDLITYSLKRRSPATTALPRSLGTTASSLRLEQQRRRDPIPFGSKDGGGSGGPCGHAPGTQMRVLIWCFT